MTDFSSEKLLAAADKLRDAVDLLESAEKYEKYCNIRNPTFGDYAEFNERLFFLCDRPALGKMFLEAAEKNVAEKRRKTEEVFQSSISEA